MRKWNKKLVTTTFKLKLILRKTPNIFLVITAIAVISYFFKIIYPRDNFELKIVDIIVIICTILVAYFLWKIDERKLNK